jgi:hypothetical protein
MASDATTAPQLGAGLEGGARTRARWSWAPSSAQLRAGAAFTLAALVLVLGGLLIVVAAADRPNSLSPISRPAFYPNWLSGPLGGLWPGLANRGSAYKDIFTFSLFAMFAAYLASLRYAPRLRARWAVAAIVAIHVVFVLSPPLALTDVFNYINYGRMEIRHGLNPYATIPLLEPHSDPSFWLSNWHGLLSPYGPLFTIYTFALVPLGIAGSLWALKGTMLFASFATLYLVWACARMLGRDPVRAIVFVGLNPLVLVWGLGGVHNDFLMVLCIMTCLYLVLRARRGQLALARAVAVAQSSSWWAPAVTGSAVVSEPGRSLSWRERLTGRLSRAPSPGNGNGNGNGHAGSGAQGVLALAPAAQAAERVSRRQWLASQFSWGEFAAGIVIVAAVALKASAAVLVPVVVLGARRRLAVALGVLVGAVVFGTASLVAFGTHLPDLATQQRLVTSMSLPNLFGLAIGVGGETSTIHNAADLVLASVAVCSAIWAYRKRVVVGPAAAATVALLVTLSWVLPWYVLWILPLAALTRWRWLRAFAIVYSAYLILAWFPLQSNFFRTIHFNPNASQLAISHQQEANRLLNN